MEIVLFVAFVLALGVASLLGWSVDSRDGADWAPSDSGRRSHAGRPAAANGRAEPP